MLYPLAIQAGDRNTAFGVIVPDLPGFFSAGDSYQDALVNAREAITLHLESLADMGLDSPAGLTADHYRNNPEYQGWLWDVVEV